MDNLDFFSFLHFFLFFFSVFPDLFLIFLSHSNFRIFWNREACDGGGEGEGVVPSSSVALRRVAWIVVDEVQVAVDGVLIEGVVLFGGRREVEVEFGDLDEPVDESEECRPLVRRGWGREEMKGKREDQKGKFGKIRKRKKIERKQKKNYSD